MDEVILRTQNFDAIQSLCLTVKEESQMVGLIGYPGAGKTTAFDFYTSQYDDAIYMWVQKTMTTKEFYIHLLNVTGYEMSNRMELSIHHVMNLIANRLSSYSGKKLLIIDEAGKFTAQQLEFIHELRDLTKDYLGIVLSGPEYFHENLIKWKINNVVGIPELEGRIMSYVWLERPLNSEIKAFCNHYGIFDMRVIKKQFYGIDNFRDLMNEIKKYLGK